MVRLLLIYAIRRQNEWSHMPRPALGLGYIASYLRKYHDNIEIKIVERSYEYDINKLINKYRPDIVGISSTTQEYRAACIIADKIKNINNNIIVVIGGHHITSMPETLSKNADIGVIGEGEQTFLEIVQAHDDKNLLSILDKILGIIYWKNDNIVMTKRRDLIKPIDNIPFPARDLLNIEKVTHMFTSRGCPYRCIYCSSASFWESYRFHSPEYTVQEIEELISKFRVKEIQIEDDLFIANKKRVERIAELIKRECIDKKVTFQCLCRANLINGDILKHLKSMNVKNICIGIETGSETVLQRIKVGSVTVQQNRDAVKIARKNGLNVHGFFMIGAPEESKQEMLDTYQFVKNNPLNSGQISVMVPYPGTELWDYAISKHMVSRTMNWDAFDMDFIKNNKEYLVVDDRVSRQDMLDIYLKIRHELEKKKPFYIRNLEHTISFYRKDIKTLPKKIRKFVHN